VHAVARVHPHDGDPATEAIGTDFLKLETVVPAALADRVVNTIQRAATTGQSGDGMVFKIPVADAVRIRSGEHWATAL
jgi:nitrogen regulatory protein PII